MKPGIGWFRQDIRSVLSYNVSNILEFFIWYFIFRNSSFRLYFSVFPKSRAVSISEGLLHSRQKFLKLTFFRSWSLNYKQMSVCIFTKECRCFQDIKMFLERNFYLKAQETSSLEIVLLYVCRKIPIIFVLKLFS